MYYHTSGTLVESSLITLGFIVVTLGILGGLMSSQSRKMAVAVMAYAATAVAVFAMARL